MDTPQHIKDRLEYLRAELRAERISYGELAELQGLAPHIEPGDVELAEPAGIPEHPSDRERVAIDLARERYAIPSSDNLEIDDAPATSDGEDGVWVAAWVFIPNEDLPPGEE